MNPDDLAGEFQTALSSSREADIRRRFDAIGAAPAAAPENSAAGAPPAVPGGEGAGASEKPASGQPSGNSGLAAWTSKDTETAGRMARGAMSVGADLIEGGSEAVPQIAGGIADAVNNFLGTVEDLDTQIEQTLGLPELDPTRGARLPTTDAAGSVSGGLIRSTSQFLTGFLPGVKALKAAGAGAGMVQSMAAGAAADLAVWDPHEERLSTWLNEVPSLAAVVPDYLADNDPENESDWEGRLKNAVEGAGLGLATDALTRVFRAYKANRKVTVEARRAAVTGRDLSQLTAKQALADQSRADIIHPLQPGALDGLGDQFGPMVITGETMGRAVQLERDARDLRLVNDALQAGGAKLQARFTKDGISVIGPDRKRVAVLDRPEAMDETFLGAIGERIEKSGAVGTALDNVKARIKAAEAAGKPVKPGDDPLLDALTLARKGPGPDPVVKAKLPGKPMLALLRQRGGVKPGSPLAAELNAMGVNTRSAPGLFRNDGMGAFDNIPRSEEADWFPGSGDADLNDYIGQDEFLAALDEELGGNPRVPAFMQAERQAWVEAVEGADDLRRNFEAMGVDFETMDDAAARARIAQVEGERARLADMEDTPPPGSADDYGVEYAEGAAPDVAADPRAAVPVVGPHKIYINHARINAPEDVKKLIQEFADNDADAINAKRRGTVSNAQTLKESAAEFQSLGDLIGRSPGPMSAAEAVAARKILTTSGEQLVDLAKKAGAEGATAADAFAFRRAMQVHYAIQAEVVAARTETARALQSWAIPAGSSKMRADAINQLLAKEGGAGDTAKLANAIASLANNPGGLNAAVAQTMRGKLKDVLFEAWINGLLASPKTHMVNALSNSITAAWSIPERYLAAGIDNVFFNGDIKGGEVVGQMYGAVRGMRDGFRFAANVQARPELADLMDNFTKTENPQNAALTAATFNVDPNSAWGRALDYTGVAIRSPGSALEASDRFFKAVNYRMELHSLAFRQAASEGLEGDALASRITDIMADPPASIREASIHAARENTFTSQLGPMGRSWQQSINKTPFGRVVVPFIRTPANIMKYVFKRTPLAIASGQVRADMAAGGARASQAYARVGLGSMVMLTMGGYAADGRITGNGPSDPKLRQAKMRSGWKPYSVKIGDRWYQFNRLDPLGMLVGLGADIGEVIGELDDPDAENLATAGVVAIAQNLASRTWASGVFDLVSALDPGNPVGGFEEYFRGLGKGLVPFSGLMRHLRGVADPVMRDVSPDPADADDSPLVPGIPEPIAEFINGMLNDYRNAIPGLSDSLPARLDLWGRPITTDTGLGWMHDFLSPIGGALDKSDAVDDLIVDQGIKLSMPQRTIRGVKLTADEYAQFVALSGKPAKDALDRLVKSPAFKRLSGGPDGAQADMIRNIVSSYQEQARARMMMSVPRLRHKWTEKLRDDALKLTMGAQGG